MRVACKFIGFVAVSALGSACAVGPAGNASTSTGSTASTPTVATRSSGEDQPAKPPRPLPFKGRLIDGALDGLPPTIAHALTNDSAVTFSYREELSHDEYHIPLIVSAFDPVTYVGAPLGDFGVTAAASLTIFDGDRVIGDYAAKVHVSKYYTLYHEPTHRELEDAARAAVRDKIDAKLAADSDRLAAATAVNPASGTSPPER